MLVLQSSKLLGPLANEKKLIVTLLIEKLLPVFFNQLFKFALKKYVESSLFKKLREFFFVQFGNVRVIMESWLLQNLVLQVRISHRLFASQIITQYSAFCHFKICLPQNRIACLFSEREAITS